MSFIFKKTAIFALISFVALSNARGMDNAQNDYKETRNIEYYKHLCQDKKFKPYGYTPLQFAVRDNNLEVIEELINEGADLYATNEFGMTVLHVAAYFGSVEATQKILELTKNIINAEDENKLTPLHVAAQKNHSEIIRLLIENGADLCATNEFGMTVLHVAAYFGSVEATQKILELGKKSTKNFINAKDENKLTPLHVAVQKNHLKIIILLIENGANIWSTDKEGLRALHRAVNNGFFESTKMLSEEEGEDVTPEQSEEENEITNLTTQLSKINISKKPRWTPVHAAAAKNNPVFIHLIKKNKEYLSIPSKEGFTALLIAAQHNALKAVKELLDEGANIFDRCSNQCNALHFAAQANNIEIIHEIFQKIKENHPIEWRSKKNELLNQINSNGKKPMDLTTNNQCKNMLTPPQRSKKKKKK